MHELGVVMHIIKTIEGIAKENSLVEVGSITLEIGEVSSILPEYLKDCWNYAHKKSDLLCNTELKLETIEAVSICNECEKTYSTIEYKKQCPNCGSYITELVTGDEFNIKEIEAC